MIKMIMIMLIKIILMMTVILILILILIMIMMIKMMMMIMIMILPNEDNTSGNNLFDDDDLCSSVSGSRIAPDRYWLALFASNKTWRYLRRFSSLLSTPTSLNLIPIVPLLSSHAVMPLPDCVKCCAVFNNASFADLDKWEPKWWLWLLW